MWKTKKEIKEELEREAFLKKEAELKAAQEALRANELVWDYDSKTFVPYIRKESSHG